MATGVPTLSSDATATVYLPSAKELASLEPSSPVHTKESESTAGRGFAAAAAAATGAVRGAHRRGPPIVNAGKMHAAHEAVERTHSFVFPGGCAELARRFAGARKTVRPHHHSLHALHHEQVSRIQRLSAQPRERGRLRKDR